MKFASRLTVFTLSMLAVLVFLQYRLWFESGGVKDMLKIKTALAQQTLENEKLKKRNDELVFQIERLQHSADGIESRARNELGMVRKDEKFYQIVK